MSFSSLNARTLLFARPVFTVIENMACRSSSTQVEEEEQEKNKTRKRKWGREDKKNKTDTLGLLYVGHRQQRKEHRPFRPLL
jgi:hypothetical protein